MQDDIFNPADWVYVADNMGRLGKGYYKNRRNPSQTLSPAAFERKRGESPRIGKIDKEQNINKFTQATGGDRLSGTDRGAEGPSESVLTPWENPVFGEQRASASSKTEPTTKEKSTPVSTLPEAKKKEKTPKPVVSPPQPMENKESNGGENEAGSEGTVICTELHRRGLMSLSAYRNSHLYARTCLPASFMRGYQFWAVPYVGLMKRFEWAVAFILPFVRWRTSEILYRLGKRPCGSRRGKVLCAVHDRLCVALGRLLPDSASKEVQDHKTVVCG